MICFLRDRHGLDRNLDAEVAARDHDAVGGGDDGVEFDQRLVLLDLGDDRHALVAFGHERLNALDVLGGAHERERDIVDVVFQPERQITRNRDGVTDGMFSEPSGIADALRRPQVAAELHGRLDLARALADDLQDDLAVLEVEALPDLDVGRQIGVVGADALDRSLDRIRGDDKSRAAVETNRGHSIGQRTGTHFRAGEILEDCRVNSEIGRDLRAPWR